MVGIIYHGTTEVVPLPTIDEVRESHRELNKKPPKNRPVKLRFSYTSYPDTDDSSKTRLGLDAHFARNGRFYGICSIFRCNTKTKAWYIEMLIPGGGYDYLSLCNPVLTLAEAKLNARVIVESVIADFQGISLT